MLYKLGLSFLLALITTQVCAMGNYYQPWSGYYYPGNYSHWSPYSVMPSYNRPMPVRPQNFMPYQLSATPWNNRNSYNRQWYRINKPMPWGALTGGISGDGNFWVNIKVSGNFQDLQTLMMFIKMSTSMRQNANQGVSVMPVSNMD